jgi:hypothetical protein
MRLRMIVIQLISSQLLLFVIPFLYRAGQDYENSWNDRQLQGIIYSAGCLCGLNRFHLRNVGRNDWTSNAKP